MRIDDIDPPRQQAGAIDVICQQLDAFGLYWDKKVYQSERCAHYQAAIDQLLEQKLAFYCQLSRQQIRKMPQGHPGISAAVSAGPDRNVRLSIDAIDRTYHDSLQGSYTANLQALGGAFVIGRRDGFYSYHLACAIDDSDMGMTQVLRGEDLRYTTPHQTWLLHLLNKRVPEYGHLPLAVEDGHKLSKSEGSAQLDMQQKEALLVAALRALGMMPESALANSSVAAILEWALQHWGRRLLPAHAIDIHQVM